MPTNPCSAHVHSNHFACHKSRSIRWLNAFQNNICSVPVNLISHYLGWLWSVVRITKDIYLCAQQEEGGRETVMIGTCFDYFILMWFWCGNTAVLLISIVGSLVAVQGNYLGNDRTERKILNFMGLSTFTSFNIHPFILIIIRAITTPSYN